MPLENDHDRIDDEDADREFGKHLSDLPRDDDDDDVIEDEPRSRERIYDDDDGLGERSRRRVLESRAQVKDMETKLQEADTARQRAEHQAMELAGPNGQRWLRTPEGRAWQRQTHGFVYTERLDEADRRGGGDDQDDAAEIRAVAELEARRVATSESSRMARELDIRDDVNELSSAYPDHFSRRKDGAAVRDVMFQNPKFTAEQAFFAAFPDRVKEMRGTSEVEEYSRTTKPPTKTSRRTQGRAPRNEVERLLARADQGDTASADAALGIHLLDELSGVPQRRGRG